MRRQISQAELKKRIDMIRPFTKGFDLVHYHVIITDVDGRILYANKAVTKNTGFSRREVLGKRPSELWGGQMPKAFYKKMWRQIKVKKKPFVGEVHNVRKNGTKYWQELRISPILNSAGKVELFIGIEPDITARKFLYVTRKLKKAI